MKCHLEEQEPPQPFLQVIVLRKQLLFGHFLVPAYYFYNNMDESSHAAIGKGQEMCQWHPFQ